MSFLQIFPFYHFVKRVNKQSTATLLLLIKNDATYFDTVFDGKCRQVWTEQKSEQDDIHIHKPLAEIFQG